ncbi:MAG TPA: phenylalanine--tRNA ligase subunit beta [Gemmatimonadaceae bacterium]|nr:phenylalanine--tRNA ligase subunit beta [Gemmatimonadaceae bacterium]
MIISHEWLREFVPHSLSPRAVGDLISRHVVTLDGVVPLRADLAPIVVARVVESERIPETRLSFNRVDDGSGTLLDVVCGAPNVSVGTLYPLARTGVLLPGGVRIEKRKIRGFTSNGMLCSARELLLGTDHEGILALDVDATPGTALLDAMPIGDTQLDIDVLPNRPDLLSHLGVAREVAALTGVALRMPPELEASATGPGVKAVAGTADATLSGVRVRVEESGDCPRYIAALIRGVKVGPSPAWLAARVQSVGGRSVSNVVDATNYILHGFGQPVHAFDLAKLDGAAITVRKARPGETLVTLDGVERKLEPWMTIIADGTRPVGLAGIMGGRDTEVTSGTTDVLLEVACFAPRAVRSVRRALGLTTDASYRFERGVDGGASALMASVAADLIASVSGGTVETLLDVGQAPAVRPEVALRSARVERLLGAAVPAHETDRLLSSIGFVVRAGGNDTFSVVAPTWRHDIARDVDLIEEVARLRGYDLLPDDLRPYRGGTVPDHPLYVTGRRVRDALVAAGLAEARPMPFTKGDAASHVRVVNPLADDEPFLRRSLLETLARRAEFNLNRTQPNIRLFEIGAAFQPTGRGLPLEEVRAAALVMGERRPAHFAGDAKPPTFDAWDAKALGELIARSAFPGAAVELMPGEGTVLWTVRADGRDVGLVTRQALDAPQWASAAYGVEVTLGLMSSDSVAPPGSHRYEADRTGKAGQYPQYTPLPRMPASEVDLALLVPDECPAAEVERVIRRSGGELLEALVLFDEFRGTGVPEGKRSLAWRLTFRHPERTLRDKEIDGRRSQLLRTLETELGVIARTA